jgi:predicted PurR-regulated permease PerM
MKILALLYALAFWPIIWWVYTDAKKRRASAPILVAFGVALIFPVGIFIYLGTRADGW